MSALILVAACVSLSGAHITAGDVAKAVPSYIPADPALVLAWSPTPGVVRVVHSAELDRWIAPQTFPSGALRGDICFERPIALLSGSVVLQAMRSALGIGSKIELMEVSQFPVPQGEVVFPRESLGSTGSSGGALWRGFVRYDDEKKFQIWARVKATVPVTRVIAIEVLPSGKPIRASQVRLDISDDAPSAHATVPAVDKVEGCIPRRTIPADSPIWADSLDPPWEIVKGDRVTVKVHSGLAALSMDVEATSSGRRGDMMAFKNPDSGKVFRAHIDGLKAASVETDPVKQ